MALLVRYLNELRDSYNDAINAIETHISAVLDRQILALQMSINFNTPVNQHYWFLSV